MLDDHLIVDMYFDRQEAAIVESRSKYGLRLFKVAFNILRNHEDAEECISDTLFKAWEAIPPTRPAKLGAYLAKITRNLSINKWQAKGAARRGGGEVDLMLSELEDCIPSKVGLEAEYESQVTQEAINLFLGNLDKVARTAFILRYFHGESIRNICERFHMSESKIKSVLFRTRKKLSAYMEKEGIII